MTSFKRLRLVTQLVSTFILVALLSGVVGVVSYRNIHRVAAADTWLFEKCTLPLGQMAAITGSFNRIRFNVQRAAAARSREDAAPSLARVEADRAIIDANLEAYGKTFIDPQDEANWRLMKDGFDRLRRENEQVADLARAGRTREAEALVDGPLQKSGQELGDLLQRVTDYNVKAAKVTSELNTATAQETDQQMALAVALAMLASIALGLAVTRVIRRQLGGDPAFAAEVVGRIARGDLGNRFDLRAGEEDSLLGSIRNLGQNLERLAGQADAIGRGDFTQEVRPLSEQDRLGHAIRTMNELLRAGRLEDQRRAWLKEGTNQLALGLTGDFSMHELADRAIAMIGRYLGAGRGVLYLHRPQEAALDLLGSYMHTGPARRFREGEGAIGQVARERRPILLTAALPDAEPVVTGTTRAQPFYTYTFPLVREDRLLGVVELGSFEPFDAQKLEYLGSASEVVSAALQVAEQRENIGKLLTATEAAEREARATSFRLQDANAQMEEQQMLLQQQAEELQQSNAQMEEQQALLQQQTEELQQSNAQMEEQQQQLEQNNLELRLSRGELDAKARLLEQASRYKSEFLANMSHELRTPLNSIILLSKMMADNPEGCLGAREVKRAEVIHRSGRDLLSLINDVLDLSKVEAGRMDLIRREVSSEEVAMEFMDSFSSVAQDRGLGFGVEDRLQGSFSCDPDKLSQILRNLLSNAFKFTRRGKVTLVLERRPEEALPLCFAVRDTGVGIPEDKRRTIFEAFRQADGSTSREFGGTGLGLTISLRLAELLGGTIEVRSEPGEGSEFSLRLPDASGRPAPAVPEPPALADDRDRLEAGDPVILLVDDDPMFGRAIVEINRRLGYKTLLAGTGAEGLALAHGHHPAGILLDLGLPDMNGADLLHELKSSRELAAIPVYVVSARDRDAALVSQGILGYLQKPVDEQQIALAEAALLTRAASSALGGVLVVDTGGISPAEVARLGTELGLDPDQVCQVAPGPAFQAALAAQPWRLAVIDLTGLGVDAGLALAESLRAAHGDTALLFYGAHALTDQDEGRLRRYSDSIIVKAPLAVQRLQDDLKRFLREAPRAAWTPPPGSPGRPLAGRTILVVDDDPRNLFVITAALEQAGATVGNAINGRHALEQLAREPADLVFMDIMMPEMDGYETIRGLRADPALAGIPVVALTAKAMPQDRERALAAGADGFLSKPVDYNDLIKMASTWCAQRD